MFLAGGLAAQTGPDHDADGVPDATDKCRNVADDQTDTDHDGVGDACDQCPNDEDGDGPGCD